MQNAHRQPLITRGSSPQMPIGRRPWKMILASGTLFLFMSGVALAQTAAAPADQKMLTSGAILSLDRGSGKGRLQITCAAGESTRDCVGAVGPIISGQGSVVFATTSIKCGDTILTASTGTASGTCATTGSGKDGLGPNTIISCGDNKGNKSTANCKNLCGESQGSGTCTISRQ
jgi:hypothetical protein